MFTPSRLTLARERRGWKMSDLARSVRVTPRTISFYERGEREPSPQMVKQLAKALRFPVAFFVAPALDHVPEDGVSFRALSHMSVAQSGAALAAGTFAMAFNEWITERFELPGPELPELDGGIVEPEAAATMVRIEWGLGEEPIGNLIHLLEAHGVRVFSLAEESREVDAFSFWHTGTPFICLNTTKTAERVRFDAAHELAHLVLHRHHTKASLDRTAEYAANQFASAFLMPRASITAMCPRFPSFRDLVVLKKRWNVAAAALAYRLHKLAWITDWHYRELCIEIARYGRTREPSGARQNNPSFWRRSLEPCGRKG